MEKSPLRVDKIGTAGFERLWTRQHGLFFDVGLENFAPKGYR